MSPRTATTLLLALAGVGGCVVDDRWFGFEEPPAPGPSTVAGQLAGRVTDDAGQPLEGAHVTLTPSGVEATTDADGRWTSPRLVPGTYAVVAAAEGRDAAASEPVEVAGDELVEVPALSLAVPPVEDGFLRLTVFGPDGFPLGGAEVVARGPTTVTGSTDPTGRLELGPLAAAPWTLSVDVPDRRIVPRVLDVEMPELGGAELAFTMAGRGEPDDVDIGSRVCGYCHAELAARWRDTAHAESIGAVSGPPAEAFDDGLVVPLGTASARFGRDGLGAPIVELTDASGASDTWTVAGFLGGERRGAVPWAERDGSGWPLPVAWVAPDPRYPGLVDGGWVQGDRGGWLGADDRFLYAGTPENWRSTEAACFACHVTGTAVSVDGDGRVSMHGLSSPGQRWDEGAVACEACHGPGETHSSGPLDQKLGTITVPDDLGPDRANDVCGRCHASVAGEHALPFAWTEAEGLPRPGDALGDFGTSTYATWPSGSANVAGATVDELRRSTHGEGGWNASCTDCHDPHGSAFTADLRLPADDDTLCETCHLGLSFDGDPALAAAHTGHLADDPEGPTQSGRCVGCHMPSTATRLAVDPVTGAGDLASHGFDAAPPSVTVDAFDAVGAQVLVPGTFVPDTCLACHVWNEALSASFDGPSGDPAQRSTHERMQAAYEVMFP